MSRRAACGRADLLRALAAGGSELMEATASRLGYSSVVTGSIAVTLGGMTASVEGAVLSIELGTVTVAIDQPLAETPFWRPLQYERIAPPPASEPAPPPPAVPLAWRDRPATQPVPEPLAPWSELQPRLRNGLAIRREGNALDTDRLLRRIGRGEPLRHLPRRRIRCWGSRLQIVLDRSDHLVPFWTDQEQVTGDLARLLGRLGLDLALFHEALDEPRPLGVTDEACRLPPPGGTVLVLGDLGCLGGDETVWLSLGRRLAEAGCRAVALSPAPRARCSDPLRRLWRIIPWERPRPGAARGRQAAQAQAERLLRLVSPAVRLEPGLLRAVRRTLDGADAATESDVWRHSALTSTSSVAASFDAEAAKALQAGFAREAPKQQKQALEALRQWHASLPVEIMAEEIVRLPPAAQQHLPEPDDLTVARQFLARFGDAMGQAPADAGIAERAWFRRMRHRAAEHVWRDPEIGERMLRLDRRLCPDAAPPPEFQPGMDADRAGLPERVVDLRQVGAKLVAHDPTARGFGEDPFGERLGGDAAPEFGSPLATLRSADGWIKVVTLAEEETSGRNAFWKTGTPPDWAADWGWDAYGAWVTFTVGAVTQKMRWCPPGRFLMGSPEDEDGRYDFEGPQHPVTIARGFWLFDTPCTQALWSAVMGKNPSRFPGAERPVERVSWTDVQQFLGKLNDRLPGLDLGLPTEAWWEYACRAKTETARYASDIDPIAWYSDNSGKQTHPVATKQPNAWGLHDMLGNVWEWCADDWHDRYDGAPTDGTAWTASDEPGEGRVVRGGSWYSNARYVRAAFRGRYRPYDRFGILGFRCARVRVSPASQAEAEPADPVKGRQAERRSEQGPSGAAAMLRLEPGGEDRCPMPRSPAFRIDSDRERLSFSLLTQSDLPWAKSIGRDRFGLWAAFSVGEVTQKMRWISPGLFIMGSPPDEPGHWSTEGPQHEVILGEGFWLFDTPCTQALWSAVMKDNPSRFKSPTRPVEQVDWAMVQAFLAEINKKVSGLNLDLPSEARWEYACRAGTTTALYTGDIDILGTNNAPALDPIAWYGGNSGVDFDLDNGHDSKNWPEKQYPHEKAGTRPVGLKRANPWGLYDMLGNVWEWCADDWHDRYDGALADGTAWAAPDEPGVGRVVRGGSWFITARYLRAASRYRILPDVRFGSLGFRCARVQP